MDKIFTVLGTRPEIIRLSKIIPKLDEVCHHTLIHTGQSYDANLSGDFFKELGIRAPDYNLKSGCGGAVDQIGLMIPALGQIIMRLRPDKMLILGDTNSALAAVIAAKKYNIPVYHMEAGNRCYSDLTPEESNRRFIDIGSDVLMPYTQNSRANLTGRDYEHKKIYVIGNPIYEVIKDRPLATNILNCTGLLSAGLVIENSKYILVTAHRQENVTDRLRLQGLLVGCSIVSQELAMPVIFSRHPRTQKCMESWGMDYPLITFHEPLGFDDFLTLERSAYCVLTDSGTVQEEACIMGVPCVTLRDNTERPETIECGSNILSGINPDNILECVKIMTTSSRRWSPPVEYLAEHVSDKVVRIMVGV
jgi:UDP-N-acetylglucosamine 2-epimerase (non-hydrolysing)